MTATDNNDPGVPEKMTFAQLQLQREELDQMWIRTNRRPAWDATRLADELLLVLEADGAKLSDTAWFQVLAVSLMLREQGYVELRQPSSEAPATEQPSC